MKFALSDEQTELAGIVRALLERHGDPAAVRRAIASDAGYDEALWQRLCNQVGVAALAIPEEYGGAGFSLFETHVVLEELGASLAPSPLLGSAVITAQAVLRSGDGDACERLLPGIADGSMIGALAWAGADGGWHTDRSDVHARTEGEQWQLSGEATLVLDGCAAGVLLVVAATDDGVLGLFEVDPSHPGVDRSRTSALDPTLQLARVRLSDAAGRPLTLSAGPVLEWLHDIAAVAVTALQVGAAQRGLDMTVSYAKERVQFGRPIGSFQALKHRMADMLVAVETARAAAWSAAWAAANDAADLPVRASTAKAWCSEALNEVAAETVQLHGGIAITWEHDAQLVFKRAHATSQLFGQPHEHRRRLFELQEREPVSPAPPR